MRLSPLRLVVLLSAIAMPVVAYFANTGAFGPTNGAISDRYPTLLVAAGYAFAIWGLIFLLDIAFGAWQLRHGSDGVRRARPWAAAGFALTAAWMPVFSQQVFWLALAVIWGALGCLLAATLAVVRDAAPAPRQPLLASLPLSLHAGWLSLAAFLNTAQVAVAYGWLPTRSMLPWSLALFAVAAALLLAVNARLRATPGYWLAALWGLAAVYVKQSQQSLAGADAAAWTAVAIALALAVQTAWLLRRNSVIVAPAR